MKAIENVAAGDDILTYDVKTGATSPAKAAKVWPSGTKRLLRIRLSTGTTIECSEDHRFPTPAGDRQARDLRPNRTFMQKGFRANVPESILYEAWKVSKNDALLAIGPDRAYVLGLLAGDGSPKRSRLTNWLDEIYGDRSWEQTLRGTCLPRNVLDWPEADRLAVVKGLWDAGGTYAGQVRSFRSTSPQLVEQIATLLSSLKIAYYVSDTAVYVNDGRRFAEMIGRPMVPTKRVETSVERTVLPVFTAGLRARVASGRVSTDPIARTCFNRISRGKYTRVFPSSAYLMRIPGVWDADRTSYEELYLGDTRPVYIQSIEDGGEAECFDLQMDDQTSPYFIADGVATHNCYQEQIMQIARDVAGFSMGQADELRKVMGKKQKDKIPVYREKFIKGAAETSAMDEKMAEDIFAFVEPFAGYGFNKSHAAAYGWISYQTAYLKANHPIAYFAALMTSVKDKTDKLVEYIEEAKKLGVPVLPPDINESLVDFAVVGSQIRFGLAAIKGVGEAAVRSILATRTEGGKFVDFFDCARRVDPKAVNRKVYEALIKCGAFDTLPGNRAQLLDALDSALEGATRAARDREMGQFSLFGDVAEAAPALTPKVRPMAPPTTLEALGWEKETLGIFVSGHPLADVAEALVRGGAVPVKDLRAMEDDASVRIAGLVTTVRRTMTKAQAQMLIATVEDMTGTIEVVVFPKHYPALQGYFIEDGIVIVNGRLRLRERRGATPGEEVPLELSVTANDVQKYERGAEPARVTGWHVTVSRREHIDDLATLLSEWPGSVPIVIHVNGDSLLKTVAPAPHMRSRLVAIVGEANVREGAP
jgi:DNA polymerase-3 subunit alpha